MPSGQGLNMTLVAILKVNGANWLLVLEKKWSWKKVSTIAMFGPLLAMPSGQGLNMTLLALLKVNGANWLLVLEKNWSCGKKFLLLIRYHYWLDNIRLLGSRKVPFDTFWYNMSCLYTSVECSGVADVVIHNGGQFSEVHSCKAKVVL